jgi:hypothetical protein
VVSPMREVTVNVAGKSVQYLDDPLAIKVFFSSVRLAWLWGLLRMWVGYQWVEASLHKVGNPDWVRAVSRFRSSGRRPLSYRGRRAARSV